MIRRALRRTASRFAAGFDRAIDVAAGVRARSARSRAESLGPEERLAALAQIGPEYDRVDLIADPDAFFPEPEPVTPKVKRVRKLGRRGEVVDLSWTSRYVPWSPHVAERYLRCGANQRCAARVFGHSERPRTTAVLIHGYLGGRFALEERVWPVSWLVDQGLDVALAVLPHHGVRGEVGSWPRFPNSDPRLTVEGFRQAVLDLRVLIDLLRRRGAPGVGVVGMSLGGYTAALLTTVEDRLAFSVPMIPLISIADFARDRGRLIGTPAQARAQHAALEDMHRLVSPLARPARIGPERILVIAGDGDRITPPWQASRLAEHFGCDLETFYGGHLLQFGRSEAFRQIRTRLRRLGLV